MSASAAGGDDARPAFHPAYVRQFIALLQARGIDSAHLLRSAGIAPERLQQGQDLLALGAIRALIVTALELSDTPWLGLDLGASVPLHTHGAPGYAMMASGTLRQALKVLVRYAALRTAALHCELETQSRASLLHVRPCLPLGAAERFVLEAFVCSVTRLLQALCGSASAGVQCQLPWRRPVWDGVYARYLGTELRFDGSHLLLEFPDALMDTPCLCADSEAHELALRDCEQRLADSRPGRELAARVRRVLQDSENDYPDAAKMAARLHLSRRSLYRHLRNTGLSYQTLLDEVRCQRACTLLRGSAQSIERIAELLGYPDASGFSRSFKRCIGVSPRAYRRQCE